MNFVMLFGVPWRHVGTKKHTLEISEHLINCSTISSIKLPRCLPFSSSSCTFCTIHPGFSQQHIKFLLRHSEPNVAPPKLRPLYLICRKVRCSFLLQNYIKPFEQKNSLNVSRDLCHFGLEKICSLAIMHKWNGLALWYRKNWSASWYSEFLALVSS